MRYHRGDIATLKQRMSYLGDEGDKVWIVSTKFARRGYISVLPLTASTLRAVENGIVIPRLVETGYLKTS